MELPLVEDWVVLCDCMSQPERKSGMKGTKKTQEVSKQTRGQESRPESGQLGEARLEKVADRRLLLCQRRADGGV